MNAQSRRRLAALALSSLATLAMSLPAAADEAAPATLAEMLKQGGHVIYIRHATTEADFADQVSAVPGDCSTQRMLSEAGWHEARMIGGAFDRLGIPVGAVIASEYCRAWQTADLAFGHYSKDPALNFEPAEEYTAAQTEAMRARVVPLLGAAPEPGTNTVIVGHDDPFEAATGIYPEPMGVAYVLRPDGTGGFQIIGHIPPDAWPAPPSGG